ncbi:MAG: phosphatase PAP2 family protein [Nanoarchaeota archaeon]|nr:phosphatase PAP2 family protein [Nanoarchaeota archaeon]
MSILKKIKNFDLDSSNSNILKILIKVISFLGSLQFYVIIVLSMLVINYVYNFDLNYYLHLLLFLLTVMFVIGLPLRAITFRNRTNPQNHITFFEKHNIIRFSSFPSFHATRITILLLLLNSLFIQYSFLLIIISIIIYFLVCYSRILLKKHYSSDIIGGTIFGVVLWMSSFLLVQVITKLA